MPSLKEKTSKQICISALAAIGTYALAASWTHPATAIFLGIGGAALASSAKIQKSAAKVLQWAAYKPKMTIITDECSADAYEGPRIDEKGRTGKNARIYLKKGALYSGSVLAGKPFGYGTYRYPSGDMDIGNFNTNFNLHGFGTTLFKNGNTCRGNFVNGKLTGFASFYWKDGTRYAGQLINAKKNGFGTYLANDGNTFAGQFTEDVINGLGTYYYANGAMLHGNFENSFFVAKPNDIGQSGFVGALLGLNTIDLEWSIPILSAFLQDSHPEIAKKLRAAAALIVKPDQIEQKAPEVYNNLIDPANFETQVLPFQTDGHAMLLAITPRNGDYIFEIYNSGAGLEKNHDHLFEGKKNKFRTKLAIQVPKRFISIDFIKSLLSPQISIDAAYKLILNLQGAKKLPQNDHNWQSHQKGPNCGIECIFAFLKDKLGDQAYHSMRKALFEKCIELAKKSDDPKSLEFIPELQKKVKKREQKLKLFA